jgi:hypothetical protein
MLLSKNTLHKRSNLTKVHRLKSGPVFPLNPRRPAKNPRAQQAPRSLWGFSPNDKENAQFCAFSTLQTPKGARKSGIFAVEGRKNRGK